MPDGSDLAPRPASPVLAVLNAVAPQISAAAFGAVLGPGWSMLAAGLVNVPNAIEAVRRDRLLGARLAAAEEHLCDVVAQLAGLRVTTADDVRNALQRPDVAFLVAMARDHYAIATFREQLKRLAAVTARRMTADSGAPFDRTLVFARAALQLEDVAVEFLVHVSDLAGRGVNGGVGDGVPGTSPHHYLGETRLVRFLAERTWADTLSVERAAAAIEHLVSHGLAFRPVRHEDDIRALEVGERLARVYDFGVAPTDLGRSFVAEIARAAT